MQKKLSYSLTEEDHLNFQLFTASQSAQVKKTRTRNQLLVSGFLLVLAILYFAVFNRHTMGIIYAVAAVILYLLYPIYQRVLYKRHYSKFIKENYLNNINKNSDLIFGNDEIELKNDDSESKIKYSQLEKISEIPDAFYLKLKSAQTVIIPKNKITDLVDIRIFLKDLATRQNVIFEELPNWKWK